MKYRTIIVLAVFLILGGFLFAKYLVFRDNNPRVDQKSRSDVETNNEEATGVLSMVKKTVPVIRKHEEMRKVADSFYSQVDFWGKTVDHTGKPISGVKVVAVVRAWEMTGLLRADSKITRHVFYSDADGLFSLSGASGDSLSILDVAKENYRVLQGGTTFNYQNGPNQHIADSNAPVTFRLIANDLLETNRIKNFRISRRLRTDGKVLVIDTLSGVSRQGIRSRGDLVFSFMRTPTKVKSGREQFEWTCEVKVKDGGLIVTNLDPQVMWQSPDSGFEPAYSVLLSESDPNWRNASIFSFYYKLNGKGVFGKASVELNPDFSGDTVGLNVKGVMNPSGSRILMTP